MTKYIKLLFYIVPIWLGVICIFGVIALLLGYFNVYLIVVVSFVALVPIVLSMRKNYIIFDTNEATETRTDVLVLVGIFIWLLASLPFTAEHVITDRDPATYNLSAMWIAQEGDLNIEKPIIAHNLGLSTESLGFGTNVSDNDFLYAQGAHGLPGLQALIGSLFGMTMLLKANVFFGAVALMSFYGFGRLMVKPHWAGAVTVLLAISLPFIVFTRDAYTEPVTLAFIFTGLSLLYCSIRQQKLWLYALTGLVLGATTLVRIDAYLMIVAIAAAVLLAATVQKSSQKRKLLKGFIITITVSVIIGFVAWLDLTQLSSGYYRDERSKIVPLYILAAVVVAVGYLINCFSIRAGTKISSIRSILNVRVLMGVLFGLFLILASRPLWFIGYQDIRGGGGLERTFSEFTIYWIAWYIGPLGSLLAILGLALLLRKIVVSRQDLLVYLPFLIATCSVALLYLLKPSITADQVWATRRFVPIVIPGLLICVAYAFQAISHTKYKRYLYGSLILLYAIPLIITAPFLFVSQYSPQLKMVRTVCDTVPKNSLIVWSGDDARLMPQTVKTICGIDSVILAEEGYEKDITMLMSETFMYDEVYKGIYSRDNETKPEGELEIEIVSSFLDIEHSYQRFPMKTINTQHSLYLYKLK